MALTIKAKGLPANKPVKITVSPMKKRAKLVGDLASMRSGTSE